MKTTRAMLICLSMLSLHAAAQEPVRLMQQMAGVYKERFSSGIIVPGKPDEPYQAENIVEIVPFDADHAYVRAHLDFYNGHTCGISGMARYEGGEFVYHDPDPPLPGRAPCALKVGVSHGRLKLTDRATPDAESSCSFHCGVRGSLTYDIGMDKKRPIRYLKRLKASRQYRLAIEELGKTESGRTP
ncbi:hypothetical protein [Massilia sp. TN1-12]|uniref:hypothetical protein n=1 Tax=Massilia paldalensis TaxID=3377675 RepID=UPI00384A8A93